MTEIFLTGAAGVHKRLERLLDSRTGCHEIFTTENGKPYCNGPLRFSISHSGDWGLLAASDRETGADIEVLRGKDRPALVARFSAEERAEICSEKDFLRHWTAREAYVKMLGGSIAAYWKRLMYLGGKLYLDGEVTDVKLTVYDFGFGVGAVCTEK